MATTKEELIVPFRGGVPRHLVPQVTQFRSTWLSSSIRALRERHLLDAYLSHLPPAYHDSVLNTVVGVWLPAEIALAHYEACDELHLSASAVFEIGAEVGKHSLGTVMSVAVSLAKGAGVTPWTIIMRFPDVWNRIWIGGAVAVYKLGPKEARLEVAGWPSSRTTYCRIALRGVITNLVNLFCEKAYAKDVPSLCTANTLGYRFSWA
jgi:hypothetical protein